MPVPGTELECSTAGLLFLGWAVGSADPDRIWPGSVSYTTKKRSDPDPPDPDHVFVFMLILDLIFFSYKCRS